MQNIIILKSVLCFSEDTCLVSAFCYLYPPLMLTKWREFKQGFLYAWLKIIIGAKKSGSWKWKINEKEREIKSSCMVYPTYIFMLQCCEKIKGFISWEFELYIISNTLFIYTKKHINLKWGVLRLNKLEIGH